jgi:competence protein ComEA
MSLLSRMFHPRDQGLLTFLALLGGLGILAFVYQQWNASGRAIEIDEASRFENRFLVDINSAEWPEISNLPGVGPKLAQAIVSFRTEHGPFRELADIERVPGIGPKKLEQLQPMIAQLNPHSPLESEK